MAETSDPSTTPDLTVQSLGPAEVPSPLKLSTLFEDGIANYTPDNARVLVDPCDGDGRGREAGSFELAGAQVEVVMRTSSERGVLVADAIRWTPAAGGGRQ